MKIQDPPHWFYNLSNAYYIHEILESRGSLYVKFTDGNEATIELFDPYKYTKESVQTASSYIRRQLATFESFDMLTVYDLLRCPEEDD